MLPLPRTSQPVDTGTAAACDPRVRRCCAMPAMDAGACPRSTHDSSAPIESNEFGPTPPPQCRIPGTMNSRIQSAFDEGACVACARARIEIDAGARRNALIGPPVIHEELAAASGERRQIRIDRREQALRHADRLGEVALERERSPIPRGILEDHVFIRIERCLVRVGPAEQPAPSKLAAALVAGKISSPVFGSFSGLMATRADSTCAAVRQSGPSAPLHSRTSGSKRQLCGSSISPSRTPSSASHESSTALLIAGYRTRG